MKKSSPSGKGRVAKKPASSKGKRKPNGKSRKPIMRFVREAKAKS